MYYAPENISLEEAKHIAVNRAKIEAVSEAFGTLVTQNNATVISNSDGKSENRFLSIGGSEVKGEWIETTKQPEFDINLKSATKSFIVLFTCTRPLITELADKLRLKYPLLPTISPCPTMRLEAIRSIIPISCRRYPKSV